MGADRALKRLALMRVGDVDLWQAPLAFVGQSTSGREDQAGERRGAARPSHHEQRAPASRVALRQGDLAAPSSCPERPDHAARSRSSISTTSCAMRSRTCCRRRRSMPRWWMRAGVLAGVLSVEIVSEFLDSPEAKAKSTPRPSGPRAMTALAGATPADWPPRRGGLPQGPVGCHLSGRGERAPFASAGPPTTSTAISRRLLQHLLLLVPVAVVLGFAIAFGLALVSHRGGCSSGLQVHDGNPLHDPLSPSSPAPADDRAEAGHGDHRAQRLHAADHLPQHSHRARERPGRKARTRGAGWG